jgi:hypothetical protein
MIIDTSKTYQPYFQAYVKAHNLKNGDEVKFYQYASWIDSKHEEFKKHLGPDGYQNYVERFIKFLEEGVKENEQVHGKNCKLCKCNG